MVVSLIGGTLTLSSVGSRDVELECGFMAFKMQLIGQHVVVEIVERDGVLSCSD
jgi:hypothetical protein